MDIGELLDRAKTRLRVQSERGLARALGADPSSILQWRRRQQLPTDERMVRLCIAAGVPAEHGLLYLNMWRSTGDAHTAYRVICQKLVSNAVLSTEDKNPRERAGNKSASSP